MPEEVLRQIEIRLTQAASMYQRRIDWLTSESRRLCGIVSEDSVCLVLDFQASSDHHQLDLFTDMVVSLLNQQVSQLSRFNLLW